MGFLSDYGDGVKYEYHDFPSVMPAAHVHPQYEIYFCPESIEQVTVINGVEYKYKHPAVIISAPYTVHSMSSGEGITENFERYVLYFGENTIRAFDSRLLPDGLFGKNIGLLYRLTEDEARGLRDIVRLCDRHSPQAELELLAALFLNRLTSQCPQDRISTVGTPSFYIQDVLRYISERFEEHIDVSDVASVFSVSRSKLDRDFKSSTGMTVHNYIDTCRVNQAKYLLRSKNKKVMRDIANACGFESESCFFHFFKKATGYTPGEYRKKFINKTHIR